MVAHLLGREFLVAWCVDGRKPRAKIAYVARASEHLSICIPLPPLVSAGQVLKGLDKVCVLHGSNPNQLTETFRPVTGAREYLGVADQLKLPYWPAAHRALGGRDSWPLQGVYDAAPARSFDDSTALQHQRGEARDAR